MSLIFVVQLPINIMRILSVQVAAKIPATVGYSFLLNRDKNKDKVQSEKQLLSNNKLDRRYLIQSAAFSKTVEIVRNRGSRNIIALPYLKQSTLI